MMIIIEIDAGLGEEAKKMEDEIAREIEHVLDRFGEKFLLDRDEEAEPDYVTEFNQPCRYFVASRTF